MAKKFFPGRFENKVAMFNGVGRGSTKEAAVRMAAEGADVVLVDAVTDYVEKAAEGCRAHGNKVLAFTADVRNLDKMTQVVSEAIEKLGKIDIFVHGAADISGVGGPLRVFLDTDIEEWQRRIEVSYIGFLIGCKLVLPGMIERKYGKIIGIATDASRQGSTGEALEGGARAGIIGFSKTVAREVARNGINVNIVSPGPHLTPLVKGSIGSDDAEFFNKIVDGLTRWIPFKRMGEPEEIAAATCFLASDDASFITGQTLSVSGGLTMF